MKHLFVFILLTFPAFGQFEQSAVAKTASEPLKKFEKVDDDTLRIGEVTLKKSSRELSYPAVLNLADGILEFLIVHQDGKIHESLFRTTASPLDINLAMTLLRYQPSKELYRIPSEPGLLTDEFYPPPAENKDASRISIFVEVDKDGRTERILANDWVRHETTAKSMPPGPWIYGGSEINDGRFISELSGDIAAIFITNSSLINYPGEDNFDDDVWTVMTDRVPDLETKVTLVFAPYKQP